MTTLRQLPSVDQVLQHEQVLDWITYYGRRLTVDAVRSALKTARQGYQPGAGLPNLQELLGQVQTLLEDWTSASLLPVINASGVIIHTNLGRVPLSISAIHAMQQVALGYSNLEYDLERGKRGSRLIHAEALLCRLTGAEAAIVVNNNAAAVLLVLIALARRRSVVVARSQLVEIGGGFRVPDILKQSGAKLLEVGTTNRIHLSDYETVLSEKPALFLHTHRSNFHIVGFTSEPAITEIATLAHQAGIPLVDDLGSGALLDTAAFGLGHEPMVQESISAGADLVCFSGDKLLGGPQAGIILGRADLIAKLKQHPLARAVRADKLCLAALSATLLHYLKQEAEQEVPVWKMIAISPEAIKVRAITWAENLGLGEVITGESTVGGGSLPGEVLPTYLLALSHANPNRLLAGLRQNLPPIIARIQQECLVFDPRTVLPEQEGALLEGILRLMRRS